MFSTPNTVRSGYSTQPDTSIGGFRSIGLATPDGTTSTLGRTATHDESQLKWIEYQNSQDCKAGNNKKHRTKAERKAQLKAAKKAKKRNRK